MEQKLDPLALHQYPFALMSSSDLLRAACAAAVATIVCKPRKRVNVKIKIFMQKRSHPARGGLQRFGTAGRKRGRRKRTQTQKRHTNCVSCCARVSRLRSARWKRIDSDALSIAFGRVVGRSVPWGYLLNCLINIA